MSIDQTNTVTSPSSTRRLLAIGSLCIGSMVLGSVWQGGAAIATPAAVRAGAPATSIAIIDLNRMVKGLQEMVEQADRLQQEADASAKRLEELATRIKTLDADLEMMGTQDVRARRAKLQEKFELEILLKARRESLQRLLDLEMGTLMRGAYLKIQDSASRFGEAEGWDLILVDDRDGIREGVTPEELRRLTEGRQVMHVGKRIDITDQLITMMNNEYKAGRR
jgi:Skp family chaperone for outer membrane proteins